jgi:hypothetical protein
MAFVVSASPAATPDGTGCCDNWDGDLTTCGRTQPDGSPLDASQQSFVFWTARLVSLKPSQLPNVSVTICTPSYQLRQNINVLVDVTSNVVLGTIALGLCITAVSLFRMRDSHIPETEGAISTAGIATKALTEIELSGNLQQQYRSEASDSHVPAIQIVPDSNTQPRT